MRTGSEQLKLVDTMDMNTEFRLSLEEAAEFAAKAVFKVTAANKFSSCVDGRYPEGEAGAIALAGADTGVLEAAFAAVNELKAEQGASLSDEAILNTILSTIPIIPNRLACPPQPVKNFK
jgi:hypothetical protein